jgi:protease-4
MSTTPPPTPPAPRARRGCLLPLLLLVLFVSLLLNLAVLLVGTGAVSNPLDPDPAAVTERFLLGDPNARDKVAVVRVTGVLTGDGIQYPLRQLEAAAKDPKVRAVVLRVDTPGGTVTASEELYQNVVNLRDDTGRRFKGTGPKPVSVSMGGLATSGGYYVAAAGKPISAERTTITGSIGVFVAIPNVAGWTKDHGVKLELIKAGGVKAAGSFFHELSPQERQTWQDTVDSAYDRFLEVVAAGRPGLTDQDLRDKVVVDRPVPKRDEKGNPLPEQVRYTRTLADGGTFPATEAVKFGLVDRIADLPAAVRAAAEANGLGAFRAVAYDRTPGWLERLTGLQLRNRVLAPDAGDLANALTPRLWYLSPAVDVGLLSGP